MKKQTQIGEKRRLRRPRMQLKPQLSSCAELKVVTVREELMPAKRLNFAEPANVRDLWRRVICRCGWYHENKENLVCLLLDVRYNLKGYSLISIGSLNETLAHPREIFRPAIAAAAHSIIVVHNHPSGDPSPSNSDLALTRRLSAAGRLLQISLLDHVIVCDRGTAAPRRRSFCSIRGCFGSWPPRPSEFDDWRQEKSRVKHSKTKSESQLSRASAAKATKADPLATISEDRKINILLTTAQTRVMKKANAFGSIKMFVDTASAPQLEQLRTATPVSFSVRSENTWLMAVRDLQPHESPSPWEAITFQRALIDAALAGLSLKRYETAKDVSKNVGAGRGSVAQNRDEPK
jgi:proteasome lid subunit RPN8/RPN11